MWMRVGGRSSAVFTLQDELHCAEKLHLSEAEHDFADDTSATDVKDVTLDAC